MSTTYGSPPRQENGLGTAGLVLGIIALVICLIPVLGLFGAPLALIGIGISIPAMLRARSGRASNSGPALAGLILSGIALLAAIAWLALGVFAANNVQQNVGAPVTGTSGAATKAGDRPVKLGTTVAIDDFLGQGKATVSVDKFTTKATSNNRFVTPGKGNRFVAAHVAVKNTGKKTYTNMSWVGAKVYTRQGQAYPATLQAESGDGRALPVNIDLKPGGKVDGWIMFEVPTDAKVTSVVFDEAEWTL